MGTIGKHNGTEWIRMRYSEAFPHSDDNSFYFWALDDEGRPTGEYFKSRQELEAWAKGETP